MQLENLGVAASLFFAQKYGGPPEGGPTKTERFRKPERGSRKVRREIPLPQSRDRNDDQGQEQIQRIRLRAQQAVPLLQAVRRWK